MNTVLNIFIFILVLAHHSSNINLIEVNRSEAFCKI